MKLRTIGKSDVEWHARFFTFVSSVFGSPDAEHWLQWRDHGWTESYEVFALTDGDRIVSTIGRCRMQLVIDGAARPGYQLGAVATLEQHRRQGLARRLMARVVDDADATHQPIILFANASVLGFYPRFGFRQVPQRRSIAHAGIAPLGPQAQPCHPANPDDRSRLAALCARAQPIRGQLTARDYWPALLWHLVCRKLTGFWLPEHDAVVVATLDADRLVLHDVIAAAPFDLRSAIPRLITQPIAALEFQFDPEDWWQSAEHSTLDDGSSRLFVRGDAGAIVAPVQFPGCAHT